jgi:tetratricopeptide (TPR) repeat protein
MQTVHPRHRFHSRRLRSAAIALALPLLASAAAVTGCTPAPKANFDGAMRAYEAGDFGQAAKLANECATRGKGLERDRARYLEGIALLKAERNSEAAETLRPVADAGDKELAADARISLGTAEIRLRRYEAAAESYRRAALILPAADAKRAYSVAARCYDAAGLAKKAEEARSLAGEPRVIAIEGAAIEAPVGATPPKPKAEAPTEAPAEATGAPTVVNGIEIEPIRFVIQAGAYREEARAQEVARTIRAACQDAGCTAPRVVRKDRGKGDVVYAVQFGEFPTRLAAGMAMRKFPKLGYTVERSEK